jgi:hypothetical protein
LVEGPEAGGVFPTTRGDLKKQLILDGRSEPFDVHGGVYARVVRSVGNGTVRGPILAGESVHLEVEAPATQRLFGGLSAPQEVSTQPVGNGSADLDMSPTASPEGIRFVIRGDVAAGERITLRNALVLGSVRAPVIRLESSIVFGQIIAGGAPGELHAVCSTLGVYHARRVIMEGPTTILVAGGSSDEEPDFRDHEPVEGSTAYPFSMRLLSLCRQKKIGCGLPNSTLKELPETVTKPERFTQSPGISCAYWLHRACPFHRGVTLGGADFTRADPRGDRVELAGSESAAPSGDEGPVDDGAEQKDAELSGEQGSDGVSDQETGRWYFGLQNRAQNLTPLVESDAFFDSVLHRVFAYEHLSDKARARLLKDLKGKRLSSQEARILRMAVEGLVD